MREDVERSTVRVVSLGEWEEVRRQIESEWLVLWSLWCVSVCILLW